MEEKDIELRSDEVQEILGTPPGWIVRWGTLALFAGVAAMLLGAWLIRYPDVISAKVVLTTAVPPVEVVARAEGHVSKLAVADNQEVKQGEVLVVLQSTAKYEDVLRLDHLVAALQTSPIDTLQNLDLPRLLEVGELQGDYSIFTQNAEALRFGKSEKSSSVASNVSAVQQQIQRLEDGIRFDEKSKEKAARQLENAEKLFEKQKDLLNLGVISQVEYERERLKLAEVERQKEAIEEAIIRKRNDIIGLRKSIGEITFSEREDVTTLAVKARESLNALRSSLDKWKQTYLLTAPIDGRVSMNAAFFSEKQFVKMGEQVMTLVPPTSSQIVGRVMLPVVGSGKVKSGQRVILRLDSYPYYEFGTVEGRVESKSIVPKDNLYAIQLSLPNDLKTSYNKQLTFEQQLQGEAQIITEDKRFLERIIDQIFARTTAYN